MTDDAPGYRNTFWVRGTSFRTEEASRAGEGMDVLFQREPDNKHDPNAIKVLARTNGTLIHIGYVPMELTKQVGRLLGEMEADRGGGYWNAQISRHLNDRKGIGIEIVFYSDVLIPRQAAVGR